MLNLKQEILKVLEYAVWAPSAENNQPWLFRVGENELQIFFDPQRELLFEPHHMFTFLSIGALVKNIKIAALCLGLQVKVRYIFHDNLVAKLSFEPGDKRDHDLFPYIKTRVTNRKRYFSKPIADQILKKLSIQKDNIAVKIFQDKTIIRRIAYLVMRTEKIRFEIKSTHEELYHNLRFTKEEEERKRDGLYIKTLELGLLGELVLKILRYWEIQNIINKLRLNILLSIPSYLLIRSSPCVGILCSTQTDSMSYIRAGEVWQEVWLELARNNLYLHPFGAPPLFITALETGENSFNEGQQRSLGKIKEEFSALIGEGQKMVMIFRIGYAPPPSAKSLRRDLRVKV